MTIPNEFIKYLIEYHARRDYFECHELLEEYWKKVDPRNMKSHWVGFILIAVSAYHHRRGNFAGAEKTAKKAFVIFEETDEATISSLGINYTKLKQMVKRNIERIHNKETYHSVNLPIQNEDVRQTCLSMCKQLNLEWCQEKAIISPDIVNRHLVRDRSEVIREREYQKTLRSIKRQ